MGDMAVDEPLACFTSRPDHIIALSRADVYGVGQITSSWRKCFAVSRDHLKWTSMYMHRMDETVVGADEPDLQSFTHLHRNRFRRRIRLSIDREIVWLHAVHRHRRISQAFPKQPLL